jgi:hypothetical protein
LRIGVAEAAHAGERGHALCKGCEPAIRAAQPAILRAPRIILRLRGVPIPAVTAKIASMKSKILMADIPVLRWCLSTNAEPAILLQQ